MFYRSFGTGLAIRKTVKFAHSSPEHAFQIGRELCFIFTTLSKYLSNNESFNLDYCYNYLAKSNNWNSSFIGTVFTEYVNPSRYFSMLSIRILGTNKHGIKQAFFRGYYIGYFISYNIPSTMYSTKAKWIVFYDCHYHYLLYLFNQIRSWQIVDRVELKLNDSDDLYSINEDNDVMSYKLVVKKEANDLIDPIYILLDWLYTGCTSEQTYSDEDRIMLCIMNTIRS